MEHSDENKSPEPELTVSIDDILRLERRVVILEKQAEAITAIVQFLALAAVIYIAMPYILSLYDMATKKADNP